MNYIQVLEEHNVPYLQEGHHHCREGWVQTDCPYCGEGSEKFHLGYCLSSKYMNCWRCGHISLAQGLAQLCSIPYAKARRIVGEIESEELAVSERPTGHLKPPKGIGRMRGAHLEYLAQRRFIPEELVRLWGVQAISQAVRYAWHLYIPWHFNGNVVSWAVRSLSNEGQRYSVAKPNEETMRHSDLLYGEDYCRNAIIVHEGPTDVWRTGPGAVAIFGLHTSTKQILRISAYPVRAICFDNEKGAQARARKLCKTLSLYQGETHNIILDSKDAASAKFKEIQEIRRRFLDG